MSSVWESRSGRSWRRGLPGLLLLGLAFWGSLALQAGAEVVLFPAGGAAAMPSSLFGEQLRAIDFDRDGFCDLLVADPAYRNQRGGLWLYRGSPTGLVSQASWRLEGNSRGARFGRAIEALDVEGDGWPDVIIASEGVDADGTAISRLKVVRGGPGGLATSGVTFWEGRRDELYLAHLGLAVADINGDRRPDLVCAGLLPGPGEYPVHCVFAFASGPSGLSRTVSWRVVEHGLGHGFGQARADAGDVDGDGYHDLLVSVLSYPDRPSQRGRVYLFRGGERGTSTVPAWSADYPLSERPGVDAQGRHLFGFDLVGIGDSNGDGIDDVAIAAPYADHDEVDEGVIFLYFGSRRGLSARPDVVLEGDQDFSVLGHSLAAVGDVNGDGRADLAGGAPTATQDQLQEGAVVLYLSGARGDAAQPAWARASDRSHWRLGHRVVAGDFDGDGRKDLASTAHSGGTSAAVMSWSLKEGALGTGLGWTPGKSWARWAEQRWKWSSPWQRYLAMGGVFLAVIGIATWGTGQVRRSRRLREEAEAAVRQERLRIARDLHDELGAPIHRLRGAAREGEVAVVAREVVTGIERVIWSVHPERRTLDGLACGLMDLAENVLGDTPIRRRFEFPEELPEGTLSSECWGAVYRTVQEALNNVRKHSQASEVRLGMSVDPEALRLYLDDDGVGLLAGAERAGQPRGGHGLRNMTSRLEALGGTCRWERGTERGVKVVLTLPWARIAHSG